MKSFIRVMAVLLVFSIFSLALVSCGNEDTYVIGISQQQPHVALDTATEGFKQALIDRFGEDKVTFETQNAQGDSSTCVTIANNFVSKNVDLIMANGTSALQAAANATTTIPILGTSITEYSVALNLENFDGTVGGNISGTSDLAPLEEQAQMILDLFPEAKNVGLLYCSAEPNSKYQVEVVKAYLEQRGIVCTEYTFSDSNDISLVAERASDESDVIYIPTDNTAATCTGTIDNIVRPKKVPIIAGEEGICSGCGVAAFSISYYEIGYKTGEMAADILEGKADISTMAIEYDPNPVKKYNKEICEELGISIPDGYTAIEAGE